VPKHNTIKKYGGTEVKLQEFLPSTLAEGQFHVPVTLQEKSQWYLLDTRLDGPHNLPGCSSRDNTPIPPKEQTPVVQPIAIFFNELTWLIFATICYYSITIFLTH
jgi:hypothetical protein